METCSKIYIAGHTGLVGTALSSELIRRGYRNLLLRTHAELDLTDQSKVNLMFAEEKPEYVFLAAAKVGGILANANNPAAFIRENIAIQSNVIHAAHENSVKKLLFLGSSCIYPKHAPQPLKEEYLLSGPLEETNEAYAVAKIAGVKMCQSYRKQYGHCFFSVMPTNLYGPNDNFDLETSHVLPAMLRKFHIAVQSGASCVTLWGDGSPLREFLHVTDAAQACVSLMCDIEPMRLPDMVNIGTGTDISIRNLAEMMAATTGFGGEIRWDATKPNGTPRKCLDIAKISALGWQAKIPLDRGIADTYAWYISHGID